MIKNTLLRYEGKLLTVHGNKKPKAVVYISAYWVSYDDVPTIYGTKTLDATHKSVPNMFVESGNEKAAE